MSVPRHLSPNCAFCWGRIERMNQGLEPWLDPVQVLKEAGSNQRVWTM